MPVKFGTHRFIYLHAWNNLKQALKDWARMILTNLSKYKLVLPSCLIRYEETQNALGWHKKLHAFHVILHLQLLNSA